MLVTERAIVRVLQLTGPIEGGIRKHLEAHGIKPGEVAERYGADGSGPSIYLKDPEGNGLELKGPPQR